MNSPPPLPVRTHRPPSPASSSGSRPLALHNYYTGDCLHPDAYQLNIRSTRILLSRLATTVHDLQKQISENSIRFEEADQETQIQMYWYKNMLKDLKEQQTGKFDEARCDATYYLHKYLQKKNLDRIN